MKKCMCQRWEEAWAEGWGMFCVGKIAVGQKRTNVCITITKESES